MAKILTKKISRAEKIRRFVASNPNMTVARVAAEFGVRYQVAYAAFAAKRGANKILGKALIDVSNKHAEDKVTSTTEDQNPNGMNAEERAEFMRRVAAQPRPRMQRAATEGIDTTLAEREIRYGKFVNNAALTFKLKDLLHHHAKQHGKSFSYDQAEALDMICTKLGRIVNGDPNYADNWIDISGYAKLVSDRLQTVKPEA